MFNTSSFTQQFSSVLKTRHEQRLAMALACVIVCAGCYRVFGTGQGLWASQYASIAALESQNRLLAQEIEENERVTLQRLARQRLSLPSDSTLAATRYLTWLHDLANKHGWTEVKIDSTSPVVDPALGERLSHSVQARASLEAIGKWIDEFYGYPLLHGLTNLQVIDYSPITGEARIQLNIETLCLENAPPDLPLCVSENTELTDDRLANCLREATLFDATSHPSQSRSHPQKLCRRSIRSPKSSSLGSSRTTASRRLGSLIR